MAYQFQTEPADSFAVGRVFSRAFAAVTANPAAAFGIALLFGGLPEIGYHYFDHSYSATTITTGQAGLPPEFWVEILLGFGLFLFSTVVNVVAEGAFVPLVVAEEAGRPAMLAHAAGPALGALLRLILLGVVTAIATMIASIFLVIPGIILMLRWSVAGPVLVAERRGIGAALGRSRALTEGARGGIFAIMLGVGAVSIAVSVLADQLATELYGEAVFAHLFEQGFPVAYVLARVVTDTAITVFSAAIYGALYVELRNWKDGPPAAALAEVFA
jgi:hypothetical protein